MTHYFLYDLGSKQHLGEFIEEHISGNWNTQWQGKVKAKGWMSVQAAITAVQQYDSLSEMLKACINYSGDVDTVASIALAPASCSKEVENDLPDHLIAMMENRTYGYDYIVQLDQQLLSLVQSTKEN